VAPPGNQAANRENKPQPIVSEETGLLDSINEYLDGQRINEHLLVAAPENLSQVRGFLKRQN
jgi:hypothetical protein